MRYKKQKVKLIKLFQMNSYKLLLIFVFSFFLLVKINCGCCQHLPKQPSIPIINNAFQFINGSWASYIIFDQKKFTYSYMDIAIRENEQCSYPHGCAWMELRVQIENQPPVVTRLLVEKSKNGPGKIKKMAVWIKGYKPFWIPDSFLKEEKRPSFQNQNDYRIVTSKIGKLFGKIIKISKVSFNGKGIAYLSPNVPPIGLLILEDPKLNMYLRQFGMERTSWLPEEPVSFNWWIMEQIFKELNED